MIFFQLYQRDFNPKLLVRSFFFIGAILISPLLCHAESLGNFSSPVIVKWLEHEGDDRLMEILEDFQFVDSAKKIWTVPKGAKVDGASIPSVFWNLIGPPFVGDYRRASVVHDFYCETKSEPWQEVHRMFYEAVRAGGVAKVKAKIMYAAIYSGGPRWKDLKSLGASLEPAPSLSEKEIQKIAVWIKNENPSIQDIERHIRNR